MAYATNCALSRTRCPLFEGIVDAKTINPTVTVSLFGKIFRNSVVAGLFNKAPYVPKGQLLELPASPLGDFMYHWVYWPSVPGDDDWDAAPAISLMRSDYFKHLQGVSFKGWSVLAIETPRGRTPHEIPTFHADPLGRVLVVKDADQDIATGEWWRAIRKAFAVKPASQPVLYK